jgi:hypothetical protein
MYEIQTAAYLGPDVTTHLDTVRLAPDGPDRVAVTGVRGSPPPERLKVCLNFLGGFRNSVELLLTGLDVDAKAAWVQDQLAAAWGEDRPATVSWSRTAPPQDDAPAQELACSLLRCTVLDPSADVVGKGFTGAVVELALASYPGFTLSGPPGPASPYGVYRAGYVDRVDVTETVHLPDGTLADLSPVQHDRRRVVAEVTDRPAPPPVPPGPTHRVPLGTFVHARSGDKGGDANLGLWVAHDGSDRYAARVDWLLGLVTPATVGRLVPEAHGLDVAVHPLPHLGGVNVLLPGLLGDGVAASTRVDPQAKALGEWVRSRYVDVPEALL